MNVSRDDSFALQRHGRRSLQTLEAMLEGGSPAVRDQQLSKTFKRRSTALDVQKSLQLLDESVSSPSSRVLRTPGGTLRHSNYTPRHMASGSKLDISARFGHTPKRTPQGNRSMQRSFQDDSLQLSGMGPLMEEDATTEITTTNVGLLLEEDPGTAASKSLYPDFLQSLQTNSNQGDLFSLVEQYENACREQVVTLKKLVRHASKQEGKFYKTFEVLNLLSDEEATWNLIRTIFKDRLETRMKDDYMMDDDSDDIMPIQGVYQSDQKVAEAYFKRDKWIREGQIVVDWLESCALDDCDHFAENIKFFSDRAVGYENALHRLQNRPSGMPTGGERPLVTELHISKTLGGIGDKVTLQRLTNSIMDPDAPLRQGKLLDDQDKEDEDRLLQYVFVCLRAGQLEKAQKMCIDCGQSWRAATLEGWKLFHDQNYEGLGPECQRQQVQGNPNRDIWKKVCWNMTQDPRINTYERAIYSVLCGNLKGILPVCKSWSDFMWAYFRVMVDTKVEEEIRLKTTIDRSLETLPGEYWDKQLDVISIFREIEANESVRSEAQTWYHIIQRHVLLGDIAGLIEVLYDRIRQQRSAVPLHLLRFVAHFVLFLRTSELHTKEELCNSMLETYVEELIKAKHNKLVAFYVSKLPANAQIHWYAQFLEGFTNQDERQHYLDIAEEAGLDLAHITKRVVENIRSKSDIDFTRIQASELEQVDTAVSEEDKKKISAIDWLVFDVSQRAEAIKQANAVMRTFIAMKKLTAAREVFDKLPDNSVDVIHRTQLQQTGSTKPPTETRNAIREYLCIKAYLDAMESFNGWFYHYHHGQPERPGLPTGGSFTDKVAYEHRMKQYDQERERWHHNLILQTQTTKEHIMNVLLFLDGGWMVDLAQDEEEEEDCMQEVQDGDDAQRQEQMDRLRRLILPGLVFLLHTVLHTSQQYQECVKLSDIVASDQNRLHEVFRKSELQRLLHLVRESSLKLLDEGRGPVGFELK